MDVPQVSLKLVFRGEELPRLHSVRFISGSDTCIAEAPQDRDLAKAVAVALLLFRAYSACQEMTLFRIRAAKPASFIDTILNAKKQSQSKSPICALANGAFLRLFLKPCPATSRYVDIDLARLKPAAIEVVLDGRVVSDPRIIKQMITLIAARKSWELNDHSIEALLPQPQDSAPTASEQQNPSAAEAAPTQRAASPTGLDNPAFIAIREAVRNFCQDGIHEHLHVRYVRSTAELEIFGKSTTRLTAKPLSVTRNSRTGGSPILPVYMPCSFVPASWGLSGFGHSRPARPSFSRPAASRNHN